MMIMTMMSALYQHTYLDVNRAHWNNSLWVDIYSDMLSWFRDNQSLRLLLNTEW